MKFYKDKNNEYYYWDKIIDNKLTCIFYNSGDISFYKNGLFHNTKNAAYMYYNRYKKYGLLHNTKNIASINYDKTFYLNNKCYGNDFTKKSWRRFVKLKCFI